MATLGQNYPNPASETTTIAVENMKDNSALTIVDLNGKTVFTTEVKAGTSYLQISVSTLGAGMYQYYLVNENGKSETKKMTVVK
jgi:hypothetical protein